jgi:rRNA biogenesis protein RRP5
MIDWILMQVGLCHVSEISDESINDLHAMYKAGDRVKVKILKVDFLPEYTSLTMKYLYASVYVNFLFPYG